MQSPSHSKHHNQREQLLAELKATAPGWIPLGRVMELGGAQYGARIFELCALGHRIENDLALGFRLIVRNPPPVIPESGPMEKSPTKTELLFHDPLESRHRDDG